MSEQQAIADRLRAWVYWYTRLHQISTGVIRFDGWEQEEKAGNAAWDEWDKVFCWLESHGIFDRDIVYDARTQQATIRSSPL